MKIADTLKTWKNSAIKSDRVFQSNKEGKKAIYFNYLLIWIVEYSDFNIWFDY
jgi:hypothetical protein